jgi:hypothetical protein
MTNNIESQKVGRSRWGVAAWVAAGLLLLAPWVAMQFTDEVNWTAADFVMAAALIGGAGLTFSRLSKMSDDAAYRGALAIAIGGAVSLLWINAAVGIISSENNSANIMFAAIVAVGALAALLVRFRPRGMMLVMGGVAVAQVLVAVVALVGGLGTGSSDWPRDLAGLTGLFTALWLGSALLFRNAAET